MEILRIDAGLDELIARRANTAEILALARGRGFTTLADDGVRLARSGVTSVEELVRVVDLTDRMG
jgi:general secretion pathway protein E/type IV pilus assembly protein PilB